MSVAICFATQAEPSAAFSTTLVDTLSKLSAKLGVVGYSDIATVYLQK
jgi:hypothetical protein